MQIVRSILIKQKLVKKLCLQIDTYSRIREVMKYGILFCSLITTTHLHTKEYLQCFGRRQRMSVSSEIRSKCERKETSGQYYYLTWVMMV